MKLFGIGCIAFATGTCHRIVRFVYSNNPAVTNVTSIYIVRGIVKNRRRSKRWESLLRKEIPNPSVRRPVFVSRWAASFCQNCCLNSPKRECRRDRQLLPGEPRPGPTERRARGRDSIGRSMSVIVPFATVWARMSAIRCVSRAEWSTMCEMREPRDFNRGSLTPKAEHSETPTTPI